MTGRTGAMIQMANIIETEIKPIMADRDEAISLLRQLREAVKKANVLTTREYVGLALAISHLLDRFPDETACESKT